MIAALDVGTTKVSCFIAHLHGDDGIRIAGVGHHAAAGMRTGAITDMDAAEGAILTAVGAAEQRAGERITSVVINIAGGSLASETLGVEIALAGREVVEADLRRALSQGNGQEQPADRSLIHCIPVAYTIDATRGIRDPRGMFGDKLGIDMHLVTAKSGTLRNLATCVAHCHLDIAAQVAAPYASGLACLVEDELDLGVTLVDMGGGTTTIAVFYEGEVVHTDSIPAGGQHVTNDIARGLSTSLAHAERMKTLYGSAIASPSDEREIIDVPLVGEDKPAQANHVPRSILNGVIRPRIEETLELVRSHLEVSGMDKIGGRRLVLTGGASQLQGVRELAALILEKQVRMGRPIRISGLPESISGPAFSTCAGLLRYAADKGVPGERAHFIPEGPISRFGRLGQWLRENF
jgi:cell division protein FtsA